MRACHIFVAGFWLAILAPAQPLDTVQAILAKHCQACHNAKQKVADLDLSAPRQLPAVWTKVREKLSSGKMPPPGLAAPAKTETAAVLTWIDSLPNQPRNRKETGPGRVTARRLNRTEYNNTIRDLLGVHARPADDFPVDDSGYGFDNIGDVLTVSPMLMEKYVAAAKEVSRLAVYGAAFPAKPGVLTRLMARRSYDGGGMAGSSDYLPYSMRGALYGSYTFPVDAEYELRFRVMNLRDEERNAGSDGARVRRPSLASLSPEDRAARLRAIEQGLSAGELKQSLEKARLAAPPLKLQLTVDGKTELTGVIEGATTYGYDRGEFIARVPLKAGVHAFRASFPELAGMEILIGNCIRDGINGGHIFESFVKKMHKGSAPNLFFLNPLNPRTKLLQLFVHLLVAAVQMVDAVDLRRAFGGKSRDDQCRASAQVARHYRRAA